MKMIKYFLFLFILNNAYANTVPEWTLVPNESSISFTATQNNAPVTGSFKEFTATINADPAHYQDSNVDVVVNISSLTASYAEITSILLGPDWFNAKEFPKAEFKSTKFTKKDDKNYEAAGTLTIKNKSLPVTLTFTAIESPKEHLLVEGHTTVKRLDFGIGQGDWSSTSEIKDEVTINFKAVAVRKQ
ncbi:MULTISPECIES: YceI family protein [Legionella]|uniref:Putative YceI-like family protein n=1 Tax=Legionella steelei TaxID=947033 RepID=A0A0W0ZGP4_9GAMM|nr:MULTISPECIES: YceI family protein [Legionella]KTD68148.1 putative YceI-like family protein [Legionella steelei]MBN9228157.1 YceI family protein [Legionella steelei]OJW11996.1 MAG: polyisoprenoid-binding protein [Legionella sp. 39-23]